jgi:hypothetical protein
LETARTEAILEAVARELDRRSRMIEADDSLRALRLDVKLDRRTGRPRCVVMTMEWEREAVAMRGEGSR